MRLICPACGSSHEVTAYPATYAAEHCLACRLALFAPKSDDAEDWETRVDHPEDETRQSMMRRLDQEAMWREVKKSKP